MKIVQKFIGVCICFSLVFFYIIFDIQTKYYYKYENLVNKITKVNDGLSTTIKKYGNKSKRHCIVDDWTRFDPSADGLNRSLFCDDLADKSDILCRWYLEQQQVTNHSQCLLSQDGFKVPNIVFYVTFGKYDFEFANYICVLSVKVVQKPKNIYVIGNTHPRGPWWTRLLKDVPEVKFIYRDQPRIISGSAVRWPAHASDIVRLQIIIANGGIYMDTDEVFVNSFNPLRNYSLTMGLVDQETGMGNAVIIAERHSQFLKTLYENYKTFNGSLYYANSLKAAYHLWQKNKTALHLESDKFYRPSWYEDDKLFKLSGYNWKKKYAVHTWLVKNRHRMPKSLEDINNMNTTLGEIFRTIYYGDSRTRSSLGKN